MKTIKAMAAEYEESVKTQFNWAAVKKTALANAHSKDATVEDDRAEGLAYLGSILNISPSGKVYMPWACGNVMGCPACEHGAMPRPRKARRVRKKTMVRLKRRESQLFNEANKHFGMYHDWPESLRQKMRSVRARIATLEPTQTCTYCSGYGSREGALDEVWREALDAEANKHGLYITGSEGDGCDVCAAISITIEEPEEVAVPN